MAKRSDIKALYALIYEAKTTVETAMLSENRSARAAELLSAALALADELIKSNPAAELGAKGGKKTAKRGPEYFAKIAAMRKERKGGRPPKKRN